MKFLVFTDVHGNFKDLKRLKAKADKVDYVLCAGDLTFFGNELEKILAFMNEFPKPVIFINGNHEGEQEIKEIIKKNSLKNIVFIASASLRIGDFIFFGYSDGGFSRNDEKFRKLAKKFVKDIRKDDVVILITHAPPYGTNVDLVSGTHCGVKDIREFIESNKIALVVTGHLHESEGNSDMLNGAVLLNPGNKGKIVEVNKS